MSTLTKEATRKMACWACQGDPGNLRPREALPAKPTCSRGGQGGAEETIRAPLWGISTAALVIFQKARKGSGVNASSHTACSSLLPSRRWVLAS